MRGVDEDQMPAVEFDELARSVRHEVQQRLDEAVSGQRSAEVRRLARYVACDGGQRWRAIATVAAGLVFREDAMERLLPTACALELAHAASLLLDDLPSMDNATVRRRKPCAHLVFPAWAVDMGAAFLVMLAYEQILTNEAVAPRVRVDAAERLGRAGLGMIAGQEMDLVERSREPGSAERLLECYRLKSGELFAAAVELGAAQCGASRPQVERLAACGSRLGLSYQYLDDVAEVVAGGDELGKRPDVIRDRTNAVRIVGIEAADRERVRFLNEALALLDDLGPRAEPLRELLRRASCLPARAPGPRR
jgi:geranylgeranyl pyrophosphate synthase